MRRSSREWRGYWWLLGMCPLVVGVPLLPTIHAYNPCLQSNAYSPCLQSMYLRSTDRQCMLDRNSPRLRNRYPVWLLLLPREYQELLLCRHDYMADLELRRAKDDLSSTCVPVCETDGALCTEQCATIRHVGCCQAWWTGKRGFSCWVAQSIEPATLKTLRNNQCWP